MRSTAVRLVSLAVAPLLIVVGLAPLSRAQDPPPPASPGGDAPAAVTSQGVPIYPAPDDGDIRANLVAPSHLHFHANVKPGDWLERTKVRKGQTPLKERTTFVGRAGELWLVDRSGPTWAGNAYRLWCTSDGRVLGAAAAKPETPTDLRAIKIHAEPNVVESKPIELDTAIGKVKALRETTKTGPDDDDVVHRTVGAPGTAFEGIELGKEFDHDKRKVLEKLTKIEEVKLTVSGRERPCYHLTLETSVNGKSGAKVELWLSKADVFFGERTLKRVESIVEETYEQGSGAPPILGPAR